MRKNRITLGVFLFLIFCFSCAFSQEEKRVIDKTPACYKDYCLGPEDVIDIIVYREDELQRKVRIASDGTFSFPLIGEIQANGLSVPQLEQVLTEKLKRYLINPQVTVFVLEFATITVTGQVKAPGSYPIKGELSVLEAIGLAGGFSENAAQNDVKVLRKENGEETSITVRVADISKNGSKTVEILLRRNDVVFVPESTFTVTGQIKKPGQYPLRDGMTVIEAISIAGGFTKIAAQNRVKVLRLTNGKKETIVVNIDKVQKKGDKSQDIELEHGDVVYVPESLF